MVDAAVQTEASNRVRYLGFVAFSSEAQRDAAVSAVNNMEWGDEHLEVIAIPGDGVHWGSEAAQEQVPNNMDEDLSNAEATGKACHTDISWHEMCVLNRVHMS